jgi:hypothetical protein
MTDSRGFYALRIIGVFVNLIVETNGGSDEFDFKPNVLAAQRCDPARYASAFSKSAKSRAHARSDCSLS